MKKTIGTFPSLHFLFSIKNYQNEGKTKQKLKSIQTTTPYNNSKVS
jgi:hypothetical protein